MSIYHYTIPLVWLHIINPKTTQGCTSGNKDVDDCIREFQLKATEYEDVIEWIPFNRLNNIQKVGEEFSELNIAWFQDSLNSLKEVTSLVEVVAGVVAGDVAGIIARVVAGDIIGIVEV
ncbi:hypothetical protein C2G38_2212426 [Gigaspora rosea]|uniref:Uncharacterized protein n=1 Tax=Gigaspora rosea TaxID=44941 RepID=A0A397UES2_9GLOM|nr:hypothetical protein C2G38_2212426 [Gigaspora rosea]